MRLRVGLCMLVVAGLACGSSQIATIDDGVQEPKPLGLGESGSAPISFTRLIFRLDGGAVKVRFFEKRGGKLLLEQDYAEDLGVGPEDYRVIAAEELRKYGYNVMGGDDLLFDSDESGKAEYLLGATLTGLSIDAFGKNDLQEAAAKATVEWSLYDNLEKKVVLKEVTTGTGSSETASDQSIKRAFASSLKALLAEEQFVNVVRKSPKAAWQDDTSSNGPFTLERCSPLDLTLPANISDVMNSVVLIKVGGQSGCGAIVSVDGHVITAAHLVTAVEKVSVALKSGLVLDGDVVAIDVPQDIGMVKLPGSGYRCLAMASQPAGIGTDIYAIGAPISEELSFTVSKGILSGIREINGFAYLQTDAGLNPGNSGGPLLSTNGEVLGIVSWKVASVGVEGIAFGVPSDVIVERLQLRWRGEE